MANGVSLERLQTLAEVLQAGSFARAVPGDTNRATLISRQMTELEEGLGIKMLDRTRKPFPPTPAAPPLADSYERFVREVEEVSAEAGGLQLPITVGAGEAVIQEFLIPKIGSSSRAASLSTQ